MHALLDPEIWAAFLTLAALEIVLGIDNIIFLSIMTAKLPLAQQPRGRFLGLAGAMVTRILLLLALTWMARLTAPLFSILGLAFSGRDLILLGGGLFLIAKSTLEIHEQIEGAPAQTPSAKVGAGHFAVVIAQIMVLDIVFSLDSVITAVGMTNNLPVMIAAIVAAIIVMMFFAGSVSRFVDAHPTIKTLALAFLILIGMALVAEGVEFHVPKEYVYFAMAFSVIVEMLNIQVRKRAASRGTRPHP